MDNDWFDVWTRRRFGLAASGAAAAVFGWLGADDAAARKKRKKKRCRKAGKACDPKKGRRCCRKFRCDHAFDTGPQRKECCRPAGAPCTADNDHECCSGGCDFLVGGGTCSPCHGRSCDEDSPCCGGLACIDNTCGGCFDRGTVCTADDQCCFSDCDQGACYSDQGGRCVRNVDCRACAGNQEQCEGACVDGACIV